MDIHEKLVQRAKPHLEPDEQIQSIFLVQSGPPPFFMAVGVILLPLLVVVIFMTKHATLVATDRAFVLLRNGRMGGVKMNEVLARLPRDVLLGKPTGVWAKIHLDDRTYYVHRRFHKDVAAADAALQAGSP